MMMKEDEEGEEEDKKEREGGAVTAGRFISQLEWQNGCQRELTAIIKPGNRRNYL